MRRLRPFSHSPEISLGQFAARCGLSLTLAVVALSSVSRAADPSEDAPSYSVRYDAQILPGQGTASVRIRVRQEESLLRELSFTIDPERHFDFSAETGLEIEGDRVVWFVPPDGGELSYTVQIDHLRDPARYDARLTQNFALFRGEDLFPSARSRRWKGSRGVFSLRVRVPPEWTVVTPHGKKRKGVFAIRERGRALDQPEGWILAGKLQVLREEIAGVEVTVANPRGDAFRARDLLALLRWTLPELQALIPKLPKRLLLVGADDPMWRGGLSGPNSIFLHSDRPLIDTDWSSPLIHELLHVATEARGAAGADWIVEGLAEYYALELLRRSGTIGEGDHQSALDNLEKRGKGAKVLAGESATGEVTARAVTIFRELDQEIRARSEGRRSLDDVVRAIAKNPEAVEPKAFRELTEEVAGGDLSAFFRSRAPGLLASRQGS